MLLMGFCFALKWGVERERDSVRVKEAGMVEVNLLSWREKDYKNVLYPLFCMSK